MDYQDNVTVVASSGQCLQERVTNVRIGPVEDGVEMFLFDLDGRTFKASQLGRLRDVVIGVLVATDTKAATIAILDGLAKRVDV